MPIQHVIGRNKQDAAIRARRMTWSELFHKYVSSFYGNDDQIEFQAVRAELRKRSGANK